MVFVAAEAYLAQLNQFHVKNASISHFLVRTAFLFLSPLHALIAMQRTQTSKRRKLRTLRKT